MIYEIEKYTDFLCRAKITPNQFYICWMLHTKEYDLLKKYIKEVGLFKTEDFQDLVDRGYIIHTNPKDTSFDVLDLFITPEFAEHILIEEEEAFDELMAAYPDYVEVNGTRYPAKGLKFDEEKGIREAYIKIIKKNKFLHLDIISITKEWKIATNNAATVKIDKYVIGKMWEQLKGAKDNELKRRIY